MAAEGEFLCRGHYNQKAVARACGGEESNVLNTDRILERGGMNVLQEILRGDGGQGFFFVTVAAGGGI